MKQATFSGNVSVATLGHNLQNGAVVTYSAVMLYNTLLVGGGCAGPLTDGGGNLQDATSIDCSAGLTADPQLGLLQDNGGWTLTHALAPNSPARDAGNNANCAAFDQRGVTRPQNGACDIGAYEYGAQAGITSISPDFVGRGEPAFTLTVNGVGFIAGSLGSRVLWDGNPLVTTFISSTQLSASVPASLITMPDRVTITAATLSADGGTSAGARTLVVGYRLYLPLVIR